MTPEPIRRESNDHGVRKIEFLPPEGWEIVSTFSPVSTPWDYHGGKHNREIAAVLLEAGILSLQMHTTETINRPYGTGPGGSVRFGDDMMPGTYTVAVAKEEVAAAKAALAKHDEAIRAWLHDDQPMPEVLRNI